MILHVQKHPSAAKLAHCREVADGTPAPEGFEAMAVAEFEAWQAAQIAGGWVAETPTAPAPQRIQFTRTVLDRLTDTEYSALRDCQVIAIQRAMEAARIEKVISDADSDFPAFVAGCDALGIIAESRWDELLAP